MEPPARLKWQRMVDGFEAYPIGRHVPGRGARIWKSGSGFNTDLMPHRAYENWAWSVSWEGWFSSSGFAESKQDAADRATEAWWASVDTEVPRDVDLEVAVIAARVPVRPIPNSLLSEDAKFLQSVMWHLNTVHGADLAQGKAPVAVKEAVERLSEELFRRRQAGEYKELQPYIPSTPRRRRRR